MAERRMLTKKVTDDDKFMELSSAAQALYLHLSMNADDDGFCNQVSICMFRAHASVSDLESLLKNRYIYQFESGVIVIRHWRMANALRKDRYTPTIFQQELQQLALDDKNKAYILAEGGWLPNGCHMVADCLPQDRIGKNSIDKKEIKKESELASVDLDFDYESAWNSTFELYPKKTNAVSARQTWINKLKDVIATNQKDVARLIYKATKAYLSDYQKNTPDDTIFRYIPKYSEWLKEDCDYWIGVIEQSEREE